MKLLLVATIIIVIIIIVLSILKPKIKYYPLSARSKYLVQKNSDDASKIKTIHTELTNAFNLIINNISNVPINSGGITGTLDNLHLNDVISGSGTQNIIGILELNYNYKNLILLDFTKNLKFTNTHIKINNINSNGEQIITFYATAKAKQLQCKMTSHAYIDLKKIGVASTLEGDCTNIPIKFNNVTCNIEINFKIVNCNTSTKLSEATFEKMDILFDSVNIYCDLIFKYLNIIDFPITKLDISSYLLDTIKKNMYKIKNALAPIFNKEFSNINIPLFCIKLNPECLLGVDIKPKQNLSVFGLDDITWKECTDLCNNMSDCNYIYHNLGPSNNLGKCLFYNTIGPISEYAGGSYYNKKTKEIKRGIPLTFKSAIYHGKTNTLNNSECYRICSKEKNCAGMSYENGICSFYGLPIDNQNVTLDFSKCERSLIDPNSFY